MEGITDFTLLTTNGELQIDPFPGRPLPSRSRLSSGVSLPARAHTGSRTLHLGNDGSSSREVSFLLDGYQLYTDPEDRKTYNDQEYVSYVVSLWIRAIDHDPSDAEAVTKFTDITCRLGYGGYDVRHNPLSIETPLLSHSSRTAGPVIEGWQRVEYIFNVPVAAAVESGVGRYQRVWLKLLAGRNIYVDDVRVHPATGNLQSYVYDPTNYRLQAILDQNNYATRYYYNPAGALFLVKKETTEGLKTLQEAVNYQPQE